jgi:hypothetical protein
VLREKYPVLLVASLAVTLIYAVIRLCVSGSAVVHGWNDFAPLRAGAELAGTPGLYSFASNQRAERLASGATMKITYFRPPFYAALLRPIVWLPYPVAYWIFQFAALGCLAWFLRRWFAKPLDVLALAGIPLVEAFANGQDVAFVVALAAVSLIYARRGEDVKSGLILSLCTIKFHLFLLVPAAILARRRWGVLAGAACGVAGLAAISFLVQGAAWPVDYWRILHRRDMHPDAFLGISVRGLIGDRPIPLAIASAAVLGLFLWIAARETNYELLFGFAILASLLIGYHVYMSDALLLLIPLGTLLAAPRRKVATHGLAFAASSIPYAGIFVPGPWHVLAPVSLLAALAAAGGAGSQPAAGFPPAVSRAGIPARLTDPSPRR